jgi:ribonuclease D
LADLLKTYIDVVHTKKYEISAKMKNDDSFWERRPLTQDMIDYATQDVIYLPMVYQKLYKDFFKLKLINQFYQHGQQYYEEMAVFDKIMRET